MEHQEWSVDELIDELQDLKLEARVKLSLPPHGMWTRFVVTADPEDDTVFIMVQQD